MVRAMIAAAAADGEIDQTEHQRILGNLRQAGLDDEAAAFLDQEMASPLDAAALARLATTPGAGRRDLHRRTACHRPRPAGGAHLLRNLAAG